MTLSCYCGSTLPFNDCCQPYLSGQKNPSTPEALMRSRYSAFCEKNINYLVNTHWPIDVNSREQIEKTANTTQWIGLKVIHSEQSSDNQGTVEFVAFFQENEIQQLHEKSRFEKHEERWFYLDGEHLPPIKIGRNDKCFCGSQKKFKKCHGQ